MFALNGYIRPYQKRSDSRLDTLEEITILITVYSVICFTEFLDDPMMKEMVGTVLCGLTCLSLFYSLSRQMNLMT